MSLFRVGDKGKTRGGRDYEIRKRRTSDANFIVLVTGSVTAEMKVYDALGKSNAYSLNDLLLPDEAEVNGGWQGGYLTMKTLRDHGWTDDSLCNAYPSLERKSIPDSYTVPANLVDHIASYTIKLDENHRVCGLTSSKVTSYTFDLSQNEVTIKNGKLIVTPR